VVADGEQRRLAGGLAASLVTESVRRRLLL
jgi:hypothetical protein